MEVISAGTAKLSGLWRQALNSCFLVFVDFSIPKKQNSLPEDRFWLQADGKYEEHGECGLDGKSWCVALLRI